MIELRHLRYIRAVVRTGSVTAAAEAEHVAQPSVSKQLRQVERLLGVPLFHRVGRHVVPTEAARALADCADRVITDVEQTVSAITSAHAAGAVRLRVAATETVTDALFPEALARLRERFPAARISLEMLSTDDIIRRVLDDEFDLGVVVLPLADSRLDVEELFVEEVVLAVPSDHPWAQAGTVNLRSALEAANLLLSMPGHGLRREIERAAQELGVTIDGRLECRSQQALLRLVAAGVGICFAPSIAVARAPDVSVLRTDPPLTRRVGWIRRPGRYLPPPAHQLLSELRDVAAEKAQAAHIR